ncbi:MAG TPA: hypothetical protein VII94_01265 [Candidatus Saccharimonadales bacterium]
MNNKKRRYQMAFDVSPEIHHQIKILSAHRNISMTLWMCRAIQERIARENRCDQNKGLYEIKYNERLKE